MDFLASLAAYPLWVLAISGCLIFAAILLLVSAAPSRSRSTPVAVDALAVWEPFTLSDCTVVISTYYDADIEAFEASALMGTGDALALSIVLGVVNPHRSSECRVLPSRSLSGERLQDNLILIGGPDANEVTRQVLSRLNARLRFGDPDRHEILIRDSASDSVFVPPFGPNGRRVGDYGVAIRAPNPFNPDKKVIVLAGSFGHGTHAAAMLLRSQALLGDVPGALQGRDFEVLVRTELVSDWPQRPEVVSAYPY